MQSDRELLEKVLYVLENRVPYNEVTKALRERLAQPEQQATRSDYRDWDYQDQLEQSPLDRMAENAREMGRDYEPEQVPVAWRNKETGEFCTGGFLRKDWARWAPLYTAPPRREWVGLTDEEVDGVKHTFDWASPWTLADFARAIEAKLREKNA